MFFSNNLSQTGNSSYDNGKKMCLRQTTVFTILPKTQNNNNKKSKSNIGSIKY